MQIEKKQTVWIIVFSQMDYRDEGEIRKESDYVYYCLTQRLLQKTVAIILHAHHTIFYSLTNP